MDPLGGVAPERFALELMFASLRTGAMLAMLPALGGQMIPVRVRIGLAGAVGLLVMDSAFAPAVPADLLSMAGLLSIAGELMVGAVAALALHAAFAVATLAGDWIAQAMGLGFAMAVQPGTGPTPLISSLFALLMWALFLTAGGHLLLIRLLFESYAAMPAAGALFQPGRLMAIAGWGGFAIASGFMAALPLGGALLLVNVALAVAARSAPALNLFAIGFPLMLLAGIAALPLLLPGLADSFSNALTGMQDRVAEVLLG